MLEDEIEIDRPTDERGPQVTWEITTKAQWDAVRYWAAAAGRGYMDLRVGDGKAANHPVHTVSWWDVVKWCNARSEMEGLTAVYRNPDGTVFKTGTTPPTPNWSASGYLRRKRFRRIRFSPTNKSPRW